MTDKKRGRWWALNRAPTLNRGTINHAFELTGGGLDGHTPDFSYQPNHQEAFTVTLKPGTSRFFCPIDGLRGLGMLGTLTVH